MKKVIGRDAGYSGPSQTWTIQWDTKGFCHAVETTSEKTKRFLMKAVRASGGRLIYVSRKDKHWREVFEWHTDKQFNGTLR